MLPNGVMPVLGTFPVESDVDDYFTPFLFLYRCRYIIIIYSQFVMLYLLCKYYPFQNKTTRIPRQKWKIAMKELSKRNAEIKYRDLVISTFIAYKITYYLFRDMNKLMLIINTHMIKIAK